MTDWCTAGRGCRIQPLLLGLDPSQRSLRAPVIPPSAVIAVSLLLLLLAGADEQLLSSPPLLPAEQTSFPGSPFHTPDFSGSSLQLWSSRFSSVTVTLVRLSFVFLTDFARYSSCRPPPRREESHRSATAQRLQVRSKPVHIHTTSADAGKFTFSKNRLLTDA